MTSCAHIFPKLTLDQCFQDVSAVLLNKVVDVSENSTVRPRYRQPHMTKGGGEPPKIS